MEGTHGTKQVKQGGAIIYALLTCFSACMCLFSTGMIAASKQDVSKLIDQYRHEKRRKALIKTTSWKDAESSEHTVTTEMNPGETIDEWCRRHTEAVSAMQKIYPPVPG